jgi:hypothetical protein
VKISNKKFSFFSSRIQYFPHIPYVASKKQKNQNPIHLLGSPSARMEIYRETRENQQQRPRDLGAEAFKKTEKIVVINV